MKHTVTLANILSLPEGTYSCSATGRVSHRIQIVRDSPNRTVYWNGNAYSPESYVEQAIGNFFYTMQLLNEEQLSVSSVLEMYPYGTNSYRIRWEGDSNILADLPRDRGEHKDTFRSRAIRCLNEMASDRSTPHNTVKTKMLS